MHIVKLWRSIKNPTRQSMQWRTVVPNFSNPIWNDSPLDFYKEGRSTKKKMSIDMGRGPHL